MYVLKKFKNVIINSKSELSTSTNRDSIKILGVLATLIRLSHIRYVILCAMLTSFH